jgi:hypothetical protein
VDDTLHAPKVVYRAREIEPGLAVEQGAVQRRAEHDALVSLAQRIQSAKCASPQADTSALEREIDERVYRLYGLTADEIKIVEEAGR